MKTTIFCALLFSIIGCTTLPTPLQAKRTKIIECVKDLRQNDISEKEAFEICRQIYNLGLTK